MLNQLQRVFDQRLTIVAIKLVEDQRRRTVIVLEDLPHEFDSLE